MGTTYEVTIAAGEASELPHDLRAGIEAVLDQVDAAMSTYRADSEVSRFNDFAGEDWFEVSPATATVVLEALAISGLSDGAFDVTVGPLVDLWGFGPGAARSSGTPDDAAVAAARARCGYRDLEARREPPALRKRQPELRIDLSAIAPGYAVDEVALYLEAQGIESYLVEIGGELRAGAPKAPGQPWRVGIESPRAGGRSVHDGLVVPLVRRAIATSGDYRNFFAGDDGRRYSHLIDPRTGRPVTHRLASVSVVAGTCAEADALATALLVLGPEAGYHKGEERGIAALLLIREDDGLREVATSAWKELP